MTDWTKPLDKISRYFTVHDACLLPKLKVMCVPTEQEKDNIQDMAQVMDQIRVLLNKPINIHSWMRTAEYNASVNGAVNSMHLHGFAVDFDCGEDCDVTRTRLLPLLRTLNIRMENNPKGTWVHVDMRGVKDEKTRFFTPLGMLWLPLTETIRSRSLLDHPRMLKPFIFIVAYQKP